MCVNKNKLDDLEGFFSDKPSFHDWVAMKEAYSESAVGWAYMIEQATITDEEGLALFFRYLDEYFAREACVLYERRVCQKDIDELGFFNGDRWIAARKSRWLNASVQIITYDKDRQGVFQRYLSRQCLHLAPEELYSSYDEAMQEIQCYFVDNKK